MAEQSFMEQKGWKTLKNLVDYFKTEGKHEDRIALFKDIEKQAEIVAEVIRKRLGELALPGRVIAWNGLQSEPKEKMSLLLSVRWGVLMEKAPPGVGTHPVILRVVLRDDRKLPPVLECGFQLFSPQLGEGKILAQCRDAILDAVNTRKEQLEAADYSFYRENTTHNTRFITKTLAQEDELEQWTIEGTSILSPDRKDLFKEVIPAELLAGRFFELYKEIFTEVATIIMKAADSSLLPLPQPLEKKEMRQEGTKEMEEIKQLLERFYQVILYGPPGTGKTRLAQQVALKMLEPNIPPDLLEKDEHVQRKLESFSKEDPRRFELVVFHPSYEYEQFVGGICVKTGGEAQKRNETASTDVYYSTEPGTFLMLCKSAEKLGDKPVVLVIDEINRGNLPKLLGELVYALEYRDSTVVLPFEIPGIGREFKVPKNLYVIATMNSSDRSIGAIDVAIRRRFALYEVHPSPGAIIKVWTEFVEDTPDKEVRPYAEQLAKLMNRINKDLAELGEEGSELGVGQSYFLPPKPAKGQRVNFTDAQEMVKWRWQCQVLPLLKEYVVMAHPSGGAWEKKKELKDALGVITEK